MGSPYRNAVEIDETEPTPTFRSPERNGLWFAVFSAYILTIGLGDFVRGRHDSAMVFFAFNLPALCLSAVVCIFEQGVRRWLERRYARKVARGIVELEARASLIGSEHDA